MQVHKSSWCITILLILGVVTNGVQSDDNPACLGDDPMRQILYISSNDRQRLAVRKLVGSTFELTSEFDGIEIGTGNKDVTSEYIAYRQNYLESQGSRLAVGFLNLEKLFPCAKGANYMPPCTRLTQDEDGFNKGIEFLEAGDSGNVMKIFGTEIATYGFAFKGCTKFTGTPPCLPKYYQFAVICYLPAKCRD